MDMLLKISDGGQVTLASPYARTSRPGDYSLIFRVTGIPDGTPSAEILRIVGGTGILFRDRDYSIPVPWEKCGVGKLLIVENQER